MLCLVTALWGLTFPLIRISVRALSPGQFVAVRFALASLLFLPLLARVKGLKAQLRRLWPAGALLGFIAWTSYQSQTIGLRTVAAGRGGFITGMSVVLVPLLAPLFGAERPKLREWVSTAGALLGLYLLTDPFGAEQSRTLVGDLWILICAIGVAIYILLLPRLHNSEKNPDPTTLSFLQIAVVAAIALLALLTNEPPWRVPIAASPGAWIGLGFCASFATVGTFLLQTRFQPDTTPQRAALIFALEPVFASVFGYWILGETFSARGYLGAATTLAAVVLLEVWPQPRIAEAGTPS